MLRPEVLHANLLIAATTFQEALDIVHVSKENQESVFAMLAAVLWLGNVSFSVVDNENHVEPMEDEGKMLSKIGWLTYLNSSYPLFLTIIILIPLIAILIGFIELSAGRFIQDFRRREKLRLWLSSCLDQDARKDGTVKKKKKTLVGKNNNSLDFFSWKSNNVQK